MAAALKDKIKGKVCIAGIGNIIRGDDGLGPKLIEILRSRQLPAPLFDCGTAPENYIFPILATSCDTVILIDAADMGASPGEASIFALEEIANVSFSTHNPSPRLFTDLLKTGKDDMNIFVLSVQPKTTSLGSPISTEVMNSLESLADAFLEALNGKS
jgi:hydrogenase 3 maturation protease